MLRSSVKRSNPNLCLEETRETLRALLEESAAHKVVAALRSIPHQGLSTIPVAPVTVVPEW